MLGYHTVLHAEHVKSKGLVMLSPRHEDRRSDFPAGGYKGGGMQMLVDVSIDPAGNVWVSNNWQDPQSCFGKSDESLSTRCGGQGMTVFYGMAKPVRAPQIGPARGY